MRIPAQKLADLPAGAVFSNRSGRATVQARRLENGDIEVSATCDSLARVVVMQQEEITRIRNETSSQELPPETIREPTGWQWFWIRTGQVSVAALALQVLLGYLRRRFK